jgi:hypothetical protein
MDFYNSSEVNLWNGYLLLGIDGSKAEVSNSEEYRICFGKSNSQYSEQGQIRALVSGMYDILNGFYLDIGIAHISTSETEMAKSNLEHLKALRIKYPILVIFDRGYLAMEFIDFLEGAGIHYLFRLSSNDYKRERIDMKSSQEAVTLFHTSQRLAKIRQKHPERYQHMKEKDNTNTRISKSYLPKGNELALMTSLSKHYSGQQLQDLYYQRWEIEKKYHTLKNKMSVTGNIVAGDWNARKPLELVASDMTRIRQNNILYEWTYILDTYNNEIIHIISQHVKGIDPLIIDALKI